MSRKLKNIDLMSNNIVPIVMALLTWATAFGVINTKVDYLIKSQDEMRAEFIEWKKQYEMRLGQAEIDIAILKNK